MNWILSWNEWITQFLNRYLPFLMISPLFCLFWTLFGQFLGTFPIRPVLIIPWLLNWIIFWIESPEFILNWIIFWIESWVKQYWIEYWMNHFLAKFKYWIESDWVSFTTSVVGRSQVLSARPQAAAGGQTALYYTLCTTLRANPKNGSSWTWTWPAEFIPASTVKLWRPGPKVEQEVAAPLYLKFCTLHFPFCTLHLTPCTEMLVSVWPLPAVLGWRSTQQAAMYIPELWRQSIHLLKISLE